MQLPPQNPPQSVWLFDGYFFHRVEDAADEEEHEKSRARITLPPQKKHMLGLYCMDNGTE